MDGTVLCLLCCAVGVGTEWTGALQPTPPCRMDTSVQTNSTVGLHDYMLLLHQTLSTLQSRDASGLSNTVRSFVDQGQDLLPWEGGQRYIFNLSSLARMEEVVEAKLRILRKPPADLTVLTTGGGRYNIQLYSCSSELLLDSRTIEVLDGGLPTWEVFDVQSRIKAHLRSPSHPPQACFHLLAISELTNETADLLLLGLGRTTQLPQEKALLVVFSRADPTDSLFREVMDRMKSEGEGFRLHKPPNPLKLEKNHRDHQRALSKRSFGGAGRGGKTGGRRNRCSRKPLHVNFKDLGWDDWIIAPLDYEAHRCDGMCDFPLRAHLEPTNHAIIQTLMNSVDPDISPPSCCVPSRLGPLSILYVDSAGSVVYRQYEDMVVESCGCW